MELSDIARNGPTLFLDALHGGRNQYLCSEPLNFGDDWRGKLQVAMDNTPRVLDATIASLGKLITILDAEDPSDNLHVVRVDGRGGGGGGEAGEAGEVNTPPHTLSEDETISCPFLPDAPCLTFLSIPPPLPPSSSRPTPSSGWATGSSRRRSPSSRAKR